MATCNIGGVTYLKPFNFQPASTKNRRNVLLSSSKSKNQRVDSFGELKGVRMVHVPVCAAGFTRRAKEHTSSLSVRCSADGKETVTENSSDEKLSTKAETVPSSFKVQPLLTAICDTTSIAEVELKIAGFEVYVRRDLTEKSIPISAPTPAPASIIAQSSGTNQAPDSNGSAVTIALVTSKPKNITRSIQSILESASDEGLVILRSPKVGFFQTSRTIKDKRAPPACKEKQEVKEGQVLCYVAQLGGEIPVESDVSGEVIRILRSDGEPVGYGDPLIAILPSFPGIKKLK